MFSPATLALSKLATEQEDLLLSFCFILIEPMIKPQLNNESRHSFAFFCSIRADALSLNCLASRCGQDSRV